MSSSTRNIVSTNYPNLYPLADTSSQPTVTFSCGHTVALGNLKNVRSKCPSCPSAPPSIQTKAGTKKIATKKRDKDPGEEEEEEESSSSSGEDEEDDEYYGTKMDASEAVYEYTDYIVTPKKKETTKTVKSNKAPKTKIRNPHLDPTFEELTEFHADIKNHIDEPSDIYDLSIPYQCKSKILEGTTLFTIRTKDEQLNYEFLKENSDLFPAQKLIESDVGITRMFHIMKIDTLDKLKDLQFDADCVSLLEEHKDIDNFIHLYQITHKNLEQDLDMNLRQIISWPAYRLRQVGYSADSIFNHKDFRRRDFINARPCFITWKHELGFGMPHLKKLKLNDKNIVSLQWNIKSLFNVFPDLRKKTKISEEFITENMKKIEKWENANRKTMQ